MLTDLARQIPLVTLLCLVFWLIAGCAAIPKYAELQANGPPHAALIAEFSLKDARQPFQSYFCDSLENYGQEPVACLDWLLWPQQPQRVTEMSKPTHPLHLLLVTGAFGECFAEQALPFEEAIADLRRQGHVVDTIVVAGQSGVRHNAREIADYVAQLDNDIDLPLVIVGYSKGVADALDFLTEYPMLGARTRALVSVAGAVRGSPLAARFEGTYGFFSHVPVEHCSRGDAKVLHALREDEREKWLADNALPAAVRYYSVAAVASRSQIARALAPAWRMLRKTDMYNDGQLPLRNALVPGSTLLGYVHADHWGIALGLDDDLPFLMHRRDARSFPRAALIDAIARYVSADLHNAIGDTQSR